MAGELGEQDPVLLLPNPEQILQAQTVAVLDGGAQYALDIEQQVKRSGFRAVRLPFDSPIEDLYGYGAVILSGGPESVYDPSSPKTDPRLFSEEQGRPPILGLCYGEQLINYWMGGEVVGLDKREDGFTDVTLSDSELFTGIDPDCSVIMSHGDTVTELAPGFEAIAHSGDLIAGIANPDKKLYGLQFHPEVSGPNGTKMIANFLADICQLNGGYEYSHESFIEDAIAEVRDSVGDSQVLAFISGGVDSSALAKLLERALPNEQVFLVLVDHGFMRAGEIEKVVSMLGDADVNVQVFDASEMYEEATTYIDGVQTPPLNTVSDPEVKRKIIGDNFIKVQDIMAEELGLDTETFMLAMGTLYTDLIESGSKEVSNKAATIKSHHNDTELVRRLRAAGRVIEPWRTIQKDDVRKVGQILGLPKAIYNRQPFPGPGLAIRVICGDKIHLPPEHEEITRQLRAFNTPRIRTDLLRIKTVGVQGDRRTDGYLAGLSGEMDWIKLKSIANEIPRRIHGINRVVYVFGQPLSEDQLESFTPTFLTKSVINQLKHADALVNSILEYHGLDETISQAPVALTPLSFGEPGKRSIVFRPFQTINFKTGDAVIPGVDLPEDILLEIIDNVLTVPGISRFLYDLTSKPPATTELE